jgi:uncharacterized surface protein with fasciclin (FAS1) repeats
VTTSLLARCGPITAAVTLVLAVGACGSSGPTAASPSSAPPFPTAGAVSLPTAEGQPIGAGCSAVPGSGAGSFADMAAVPVVPAARHNPALSSLVTAVTRANLIDSFDAQQDITVLAPANPAFAAVPKKTLGALLADTAALTSVLTHHVIQGRLTPAQLAGTHTTLNNDTVTIAVSGTTFSIAAKETLVGTKPATVICGNIRTANATVYLIDQVLAPPAS